MLSGDTGGILEPGLSHLQGDGGGNIERSWFKVALSLPRAPANRGQWVQCSLSRVEARAGSGISTTTHGSVSCRIPVFFFLFFCFSSGHITLLSLIQV